MAKQVVASNRSVLPDRDFVVAAGSRAASVFALSGLGASIAFLAGQSIALSQRSQFWLSLVFASVCLVGMEVVRSVARDRRLHGSPKHRAATQAWSERVRRLPKATLILLGVSFPFFAAVSVASMRASPSLDLATPTGMFGASLVLAAFVGLGLFAVRPKFRRLFYVLLTGALVCYQVVLSDFKAQLVEAEARFQEIAVEQAALAAGVYRQASESSAIDQNRADLVAKSVADRLGNFYRGQRIGMGDIGVRVGDDRASVVMHWRRRSLAASLFGSPKEYEIARYLPVVATEVTADRIGYQSAVGVVGAMHARGVLSTALGPGSVSVGSVFVAQLTNDSELDRASTRLTTFLAGERGRQVVLVSGTAAR